jgi:hypothetical protein
MGSLHGYGIARRIEQISGDAIILNQGTIYASLVRAATARLDLLRVERFRQQSQSQVLFHHPARP